MAIEFELSKGMQTARDMARMFAETYVRPYALESDQLCGPHPKFIEACKQCGRDELMRIEPLSDWTAAASTIEGSA